MNILLDMVGCRLNQSEIEAMANQLRAGGHIIVASAEKADVVIVNTCCVTAKAAADSRKMIRQHARNSDARVLVTGCWSSLNIEEARSLPKVSAVVTNSDKESLVERFFDGKHSTQSVARPYVRVPLPGDRYRTRAFIKVQDGCNDHCTFCITRIARGISRSIPVETILSDIQAAVDGGSQEIVLTGVQIGSYGRDALQPLSLAGLLETILQRFPGIRMGISSIEPWDLDDALISQWQALNLNRHLHIPFQSGSDQVLKRMARRTSVAEIHTLVDKLHKNIPGVAITTDMIVGFPGETVDDFSASLDMINQLRLAAGHVFSFSPMPHTPAARFPDQVPNSVRKQRNLQMRELFEQCSIKFMQGQLNQHMQVLWEKAIAIQHGWELSGYTDNNIRVSACHQDNHYNQVDDVLLTAISDCGKLMLGKISL